MGLAPLGIPGAIEAGTCNGIIADVTAAEASCCGRGWAILGNPCCEAIVRAVVNDRILA